DLHLAHPVRSVHAPVLAAWVDAMLTGTTAGAMAIAQRAGGVPVRMTRCLDALRRALITQRTRRSGLVASSHARRLRAAGLGCMLPHQDDDSVARWFLDRWPDIRSSDALEVAATEFAIQGLELDQVGMCWDVDLIRNPGRTGWQARNLRGSNWTTLRHSETLSNRINAYRVLLTRARFRTVIWVPRGDPADATRDPALYDAVTDHLAACGVAWLDDAPARAEDTAMPEPKLL
ncbi:MAG: DUF2075 domain-containing protein, partial [Gemmatimonadaceae bacterium]|nr:DUF2075 domain-containing protein [Acetobacteraceae bacterium]